MMIVQQAKDIIRQWVMNEASQSPGFHGAFLHGSINWLSEEAALPSTSDVDVMIVLDGPTPPEKLGKQLPIYGTPLYKAPCQACKHAPTYGRQAGRQS